MKSRTQRPIADLDTHDQPWVTSRQVCGYLQIDHRTLRKFIDGGYLTAMRLPGRKGEWRIAVADLRRFEAKHQVAQ